MKNREVYFLIDLKYDRNALAQFVYGLDKADKWDSYIPPLWDEQKYTVDSFTGVTFRYYETLQNIEPIKRIRDRLNFPYLDYRGTQLLKFPPYNGPTIHKDSERMTGVIFPIYTFEKYEPIRFYKNESINLWFEVDYSSKVIVFDAQVLHGVENKQFNRYSLQFDLREPFEVVYRMYQKGDFFSAS